MYGSHDMRHTGFPWVNGGQRDPQDLGRHTIDIGLAKPRDQSLVSVHVF